jgi:erythromycin esterase
MLEFLVHEMDFRVFAIEASYAGCNNINDYVLTGKGDPAEALASQKFWTWDTHEVRDMIAWMREYNKKSPENKKVKFLGYDLQHLGEGIELIENYIKKLAPEYTEKFKASLDPIRIDPSKIMDLVKAEQEEKDKILAGLHEIMGVLTFHQIPFTRKTSKEEFQYVLHHARVLTQFYYAYSKPMMGKEGATSAAGLRDLYMAENIEQILQTEGPDTRIVVWAHNGHISKASWGGGIPAMGAHLRKLLGDKYYALGFAFNEGSFQSRLMDRESDIYGALTEFTVGPAPEGSISWYLSKPGLDLYVLNIRTTIKDGKIKNWVNTPHPMRFIGSGFSEKYKDRYMSPIVLTDHFDGIVYFGNTTRARPNPTGERGPLKK